MAITKILHINEAKTGNPATHLQNSLAYIQNPDKTEQCVLVGSINCLPETAFEQMMDTKVTFEKTNKRQGYHIVISFVPGEATEEQAFDIVERFAKEYLRDEYEAVYAVHNDKNHIHAHLIFNSVNFVTGAKYEYRKGEWKRRMQPITNKLCKEYNLDIMPAEYAKEPKNLSRVEWEQEQRFREMILADAVFCQSCAGSMDHFIFLMKRIGYQFEYGKYLSVKIPGGKWYHQLAKLDERFEEERFKYYLDMGLSMPRFISSNLTYSYRSGLTDFQLKYYHKMYRIRMVEQKRFDKHAAWMAKELQRFHQLQNEYLFLVRNDIKSVEGLISYQVLKESKVERISARQKEIYKESGIRKRACKTEEDIRDFQLWHVQIQEELDALKAEKKELKDNLKLVEGCKQEFKQFTMLDLVSVEDEVSLDVEVPEYPYETKKVTTEEYVDKVLEAPSESVVEALVEIVEAEVTIEEVTLVEVEPAEVNVQYVTDEERYTEIPEGIYESSLEKEVATDVVKETEIAEIIAEDHLNVDKQDSLLSYESFKRMTPEEKAKALGFINMRDYNTVQRVVSVFFDEIGHRADVDEIMEETELVYRGMRHNFIEQRANEIVQEINTLEFPYLCLTDTEKAELFQFKPDDNSYNLELHSTVLKACGVKLGFDDVYEDYQKVYDKTVEMQEEKEFGRSDSGRGRAR